jgi:hypothetical protein
VLSQVARLTGKTALRCEKMRRNGDDQAIVIAEAKESKVRVQEAMMRC